MKGLYCFFCGEFIGFVRKSYVPDDYETCGKMDCEKEARDIEREHAEVLKGLRI